MTINSKLVGNKEESEVVRRDGKPLNSLPANRTNVMGDSKTDKGDHLLNCSFDVNYQYMQVL
jgi:hypothetical protein